MRIASARLILSARLLNAAGYFQSGLTPPMNAFARVMMKRLRYRITEQKASSTPN